MRARSTATLAAFVSQRAAPSTVTRSSDGGSSFFDLYRSNR